LKLVLPEPGRKERVMKVYIHIERDRNGFFVAEAPMMPGCFSQGRTAEEALKGMQQVIEEWYEMMGGQCFDERVYLC
jgi:predicted RNase H-like HicB family nuclease